ncbi:hypothetical protein [Microvirga splendida]|uniref:Uncharacterized protein n=1 Tax=Microvirga splendida TaxID=2795727 RepID=A0ABS0Y4U1_9HYPH|nr:hypothetical protein [Microvirga splendida]
MILTTHEEYDVWLNAPTEEALSLEGPLPDELLKKVAEGERSDKRLQTMEA